MPDRFDDQINDFWNEIVGSGDAGAGSLDARLAGAIEQVHALSQSPISDSARERIRRKVLDQSVSTEGAALVNLDVAAMSLPNLNGTASVRTAPRRIAPTRRPLTRMHWAMLAAAALILFGAVGGFFASGGSLDHLFGGDAGNEPNSIPAATVESGWPQFRGGASRTGYSSDPGPGGDLDLRWSFTTDEVVNSVVSQGGTVYAYGRKGDLYALNAATGEQLWAVDLSANEYSDQNRYSSPAVDGGVIYTGTFDGSIVALKADTGALVWQRAVSDQPIVSGAAVAEGFLYLITPEGRLMSIDPATGATVWESSAASELQGSAPAVGGGSVFVSALDGDLVAIGAVDGEIQWTADLNQVNRVAAYRDGIVYVSGDDGMYRAVEASNGDLLWTSAPQAGQALNPLVTPNAFIATNQEGALQALDLATGEPIWSVSGPGNSSSPHASNGAVYAVSPDLSAFVAYDLKTGAELGRVAVDQAGSTAAISGDALVLSSIADQGVVRSFGPGSGTPNEVTAGPSMVLPAATPLASEPVPSADATAAVFDPSQTSLAWEASGSAKDPLQGAAGLAVAPDGTIYVTDDVRSTIDIFSPDGAFLETWGEPGSGPGQFASPGSLGFDADSNIYVFDTGNNRVQKFAPDRTFLLEWGTEGTGNSEFSEVQGAVDPVAERVYVAEFLNNRVQVFDLDGNFLDKWGSTGLEDGQFNHPNGVSIDADGNVYVGESANGSGARLQKFDQLGRWLATIGSSDGVPAQFTEVWGSALDAQGNLYVSDYWNDQIQVFGPDLTPIGIIKDVQGAGPFLHPARLLITDDGALYVTDYDNHRLLKLALPPLE